MKKLALAVFAVMATASIAMAGGGNGAGHGNGGRGWGAGLNVFVDVPTNGAAAGPVEDPRYAHCREARHGCFGLWGVDEPGYGRCMRRSGC